MGLRVEEVSFLYGRSEVIRGLSLAVQPGEVACLLGPSGCGKTTVLRLAAGLERPTAGRVRVGGRVVADASSGLWVPPEARRVGLMFQDYALFPHLTVAENIRFGVRRSSSRDLPWVRSALARVGLAGADASYPHTLSGGQQQRCALLRALAPEPDVLLLDEPFSGLDITLRAEVREETLALLSEAGVATLVVTHDPDEAMAIADRLWLMQHGEIVQHGSPTELLLSPRNAFVAGAFGAINRLEGRVEAGAVSTPLGRFPANDLPEDAPVEVLIRPEGLRLTQVTSGCITAAIVEAHLVGRAIHARLAIRGVPSPCKAIVPDVIAPAIGTEVGIETDRRHVFVFKRTPHPAGELAAR